MGIYSEELLPQKLEQLNNLFQQANELNKMLSGDWPDLKRFVKLLDKNGMNAFIDDGDIIMEHNWIIRLVNDKYEISHNLKEKHIIRRFSNTKEAYTYIDMFWP